MSIKSHVTRLTIARLFNLGSYEHVRYEVQVDVPEGQSAAQACYGVERILAGLKPKCPVDVYELARLKEKTKWSEQDWWRYHGKDSWESAKAANQAELERQLGKVKAWKDEQTKVRALLDDLGAAYQHTDAKLTWEDEDL
jgi:hypothetical protein